MSNSYLGQSPVFGDFPSHILTGDGTAAYTLNFKSSGTNGVLVFLNGAVQRPGIDFSVVGDQLTFQENVAIGVQIFVYGMGLPKSSLAPSMGSVSEDILDAELKANRISEKYSNLSVSANGLGLTASVTADHIALLDSSFNQKVVRDVDVSLDLSISGAGGLDTGVVAGNAWYYAFVIYNPTTGDVSVTASANITTPALPSGYTHFAFVEAVRTNAGATQILPFFMDDGVFLYAPTASTPLASDFPIVLGNGNATSFTQVNLRNFVPPTAKTAILGVTHSGTSAGSILVSRGSVGSPSGLYAQCFSNGTAIQRQQFEVPRPYQNGVYYAINANGVGTIVVMGYKS